MPEIRPLRESDREQAEFICIQTAPDALAATEKKREETLWLYNRYYIRNEKEHCFVLADDSDIAVGYVLCAPDYKRYKKEFFSCEMRKLRKYGPAPVLAAYGQMTALKPFSKRYPAHLHIDILPAYQHQGWGTKLLDALAAHLKGSGVPGVLLVAGEQNHGAIIFYEKYGMERLGNIGGGVVFGLALA